MQWCENPGCSNEVAEQRKKCQACLNEVQKLKRYAVDPYWYDKKFAEQGGVCAICHQPETAKNTKTGKPQRLSVDHNHRTKRNRGLLCASCNKAIGLMKDNPARLRAAAEYLEQYSKPAQAA